MRQYLGEKKSTTQGLAGRELEGDAGKIYLDDGGTELPGVHRHCGLCTVCGER